MQIATIILDGHQVGIYYGKYNNTTITTYPCVPLQGAVCLAALDSVCKFCMTHNSMACANTLAKAITSRHPEMLRAETAIAFALANFPELQI